jgi:hypothetical protein
MKTRQQPVSSSFIQRQQGQSIIEYTVISAILITMLLALNGTDVIANLNNAIKNNYDGYSYAVSLSDYPDKKSFTDLISMYNTQGMPSEQREYLTDNPGQLVDDLRNYALTSFPELAEGLDFLDGIGLGLSDFCDFCTGNPFDFL